MDYPFQIACVRTPTPLRKNRRRGVCREGGDCTQASFGSRGPSEFALIEVAWEDAIQGHCRHGNVYRSVREKQGNVVYRQSVLQTVTSLRTVLFD